MITIQYNGTTQQTDANTLQQVLIEQGFDADSHIATAVNGKFVADTSRDSHVLYDGDSVEVVAPMQGG